MTRIIEPFKQFFDGAGDPLIDGWLRFLVSESTDTDKSTYSDDVLTVLNTNPLQLDAEGRCPDVFGSGTYKIVLYTNDAVNDEPSEQVDVKDPVGSKIGTTGSGFNDWDATTTYDVDDRVIGTDGQLYSSLQAINENNLPAIDSAYWEQLQFVVMYNDNSAYAVGTPVIYVDTLKQTMFICVTSTSAGESPETDPDKWATVPQYGYDRTFSVMDFKDVSETVNALGTLTGGTDDIDLEDGNIVSATISTATQTFTFSNPPPTGHNGSLVVFLTNGGSQTVNWPASVDWPSSIAPDLTPAGIDILVFTTNDAGTTWFGVVSGQDMGG